ncbi:hypothetical protein BH09PSE6_BH09PSE6_17940 [soil metagenome]
MNAIGWLGGICLAVCCLPQAWHCYRTGNADGVSTWMIGLWLAGELLTLGYVLPRWDMPLIVNYSVNVMAILVIAKYKMKPRVMA